MRIFKRCYCLLSVAGAVAFLLICGCRRDLVQSEFGDYVKKPILNSILTAGEVITAHLSLVTRVSAPELELIDNAEVRLFVDGVYAETMTYAGEGIYEATIAAEQEKTYSYEVAVPGYDMVEARSYVPRAERITKLTHIGHSGIDNEGNSYPAVRFNFTNDTSREQYYEVVVKLLIYGNGEISYGVLEKIVDPVILKEGLPIAVFSNGAMTEDTYEMTLNYFGESFTPVFVELRTVSEDYYKYARQFYLYEQDRYNMEIGAGTTAVQIHSNVRNGYGIVAGYSAMETETIYPEGTE